MFSPAGQLVNHVVDGGVSILPIQTRLAETPSPTIGRYTLVLNRKPTAPVTVAVSSPAIPSPSGEAIAQVLFAPAAVLFTPENWNLPQEVTVTAIDDSIAEDTHYGHVTHAVVSADSHFAPTTPFVLGKVVTFTVTDNDRATVQLSRSNLYTVEGGATDRYGVVLATRPWFDVTVTAVAMRPLQTQLVPSHVVFTPQNWNVVQWIVVRAVDDNVSENEFGGVHHGGSIVHYATSRDCFYNTRQPSCYYLATCDCAGIVTRGSCTSVQISAACAAGTPLLVCDVDANATAPLGNGVSVVQLRGGNLTSPLEAIPVRYGHDALNPNPPTSVSTMVNSLSETIELPVRYVHLDSRNPNPVSSNVPGLVLTAIPADVLGYLYTFAGVLDGPGLATLAQDPAKLLWQLCLGVQRLTTQRWAFESWPPGMADRVLDALFRILPSSVVRENQLWNCGMALFAPQPELLVTVFDNDPAVTLSSPLLQVSEGSGATSQYTVVLHAPPSVSGAASAVSFCDASPNLNVCRTTLPPAFFTSAFPPGAGSDTVRAESIEIRRVDLALWQVSVVAQSSAQLRISPQFVQFTNANWFIPQSFTVSAVDDAVAQGTLNTSITHTIFGPASYANAAFWFKHEIPPTNLPDTFPLPLPYNAVPTVLQAPDHRRIQVVVADNDQAGVVVSKSLLSLKQSAGATNHVGDTVRGTCVDSLTVVPGLGVQRNVLLLTDASKTLLKFHVPTLHLTAFQSSVSSASIVLFRTQYDVVNSSQLNSTTGSALYPTALLRVSLVASDWSESTFDTTSPLPPAMPFAAIEQNVTLSTDFTLTIDVTALLKSVSPLFVVSFLVDIVHDPANLQMHSRAHLENLPPVLVVETEYPNLLASRPVVQPSSSHVVATTDGSRTTSGDAIVSWWEGTLATTMPSGTLAIFLPLAVTTGYLDIVVATDPFDPTWDLATAQAQGTAFRRVPILRPVLLWPVKAAARCIRIYAPSIALAEVEFYGPGITITTTDDGWGLRSTTALLEPKLNDGLLRTSWEFASGAFVSDDNVAIGMPTTQSSVGTLSLSTAFENNPWWGIDLGSVVSIGDVSLTLGRTLDELAACASPTMPVNAATISSFTSLRLRLSTVSMTGTPDPTKEVSLTKPLGECFSRRVDWPVYASGRYLRVELTGRGILAVQDVEVRRWRAEMTRYVLLELRGTGQRPIALPAFTFMDSTTKLLPYRIHSMSSPQSFDVLQPWGASCFQAAAASYREWIVVDFSSVQQVQSIQMSFDTSACAGAVEPVSAFSISVYGDPKLARTVPPTASSTDPCACTSSILGVISAALPSSCANQCATFQCPTCVVNSYSNGMIGETLFASGFLDIALLVPPPSLPTQDIVLLPTGYRAILLRDQPLSYWRLQKANADSQVQVGHATFGTSSSWPLGFAVLNNANLVLTAPPPSRVQWFGQSYLNAGDSSFSIEFWVSFPSGAPATPLVLVSYAAPPPSASYEIGVFANQTTFFALTYGGVTTSLVGPAIGTAPNVWTHVVATYDWSSQVQTLASNGWNVVTNDLTTSDSVLVRRSDTISLLWTGTFTLASGSVPWRVAHVASYQRALTNYETLEHFYYSTPSKSYATYAINLSSQPSTPVDVDVVTEVQCYRWGLCNTSAIPPTLRFTAQNWNTPQHVIVHGTDDSLAQGLQLLANQHRAFCAPASSPSIQIVTPTYSEASRASVSKYFRDLLLNQATAASLNQTVDSLLSMEWAGQTTSTTWVPQASYADVTAPPVELKLQSMAVAGVVLSSPYLTVSEDGLHAVFEVALATEPKHDVHIHFNASTDCYRPCGVPTAQNACPVVAAPLVGNESWLCNATVSPTSIVFTPATWGIPQAVTVQAVDDHLDEADVHFTAIKTTTVSQDPDYDRALLPNIRVAVEDNDVSQVVASRSLLSLTEARPADEENYTLVLTTEPWSEVNISVSNEAANECYRLCGYPLDMSSCGLPRALAANSIALGTSSSKELQTVTASMTTTNAIQRVMTSTTHVNPIFQLTMTGGYVLEVWTLQILFPSTAQYSSSAPFGTTFTLRLNSMVNAAPLDAFASASQVQAALNAAVASAVYSVALTVDSSSQQLVLSWRITYLAGGPVPALSVAVAPFPAVALVNRTTALQSPSGSIVVGYGNQKPLLGVAWNATADQVAAYLTSQTTVKDVMVSQSTGRGPNVTWAITFTSVPAFFPSLIVDASKLIGAPGAAAPIDVTWTCLQQANTVSGWFQLSYPVNTTFVASSAPLPYNATEVEVVQAMAAIPTVGQVQVRRRALSPELTFEWTIEFAGNVGQVANLTAKSLNLTGLGSTVVSAFVQQGAALSGSFQLQLGGRFKFMYPTTEIYDKVVSPQTTPSLPFNANASAVQAALLALPLGVALTGIEVTRSDARCDVFGRCREYTWAISFPNTPGDIPSIVGTSQLRGPGAALSVVTVANGTYLTGSFRVSLTLNESGRVHRGTTWPLPVNVTSDGVKEALEALPFVTSSRQEDSAFDPANPLVIPKATKGVRVSRQGPALDGGYMWHLDWSLNDWLRFTDVGISVDTTSVGQEVVPPLVATQFGPTGARCAPYPSTTFQLDPTDVFGLRGYCVYPLVVMVSPDRYLCNATILTPRPKFDASNWYIPQEIHVAPVHDHLDETTPTSNTTQSMLMHFPYTLDMIYAGMAVPNVTVDVEDIDRAQVVVSRTLLTVSENGTLTDTYTLTLMTEPRANVLVVVYPWLDSQNTSCYRFGVCNITLDTTNVTFTPQNWYLPQQVRMRATNDALDEADVHYSGISHAVFSSDPKYHRLAVPTIDVVIYDDDVSAFITSKSTVVVAELGRADEYTIVLSSEPFAKVTISPVSNGTDALGNVIVLPPPVVFTWRNWNIPQRMPVQAFHDWTVDPLPHTTLLSHTVATNDLIYAQKPVANVTVFTVDTNVAGVVLSHASVNGTEGDVVSYALRLSSKPWFPVNVTFNASQGCYQSVVGQKCNVTMATTSLQFTNATWDKWQFVAVAITLDNLHEAPVHTATISHTLSSRDPDYGVTVAAPSMTIRITDVDKSGVIVRTPSSKLTVAQGSFNASYSLALASEPYDNVTVFLSVPLEAFVPRGAFDNTSVVQEPLVYVASATNSSQVLRFIVFTPWDWNDYRSVVLSALTTGSSKPLSMQTTVSHRPLSRDGRYNASSSPVVVATVLGREDFPPPIPIRAAFDGTGVVVVISFDSPVFHAATMTVDKSKPIDQLTARYVLPSAFFSCDLVWNVTTSAGYLGDGAKCLWLDLQTLQITLGNRATLLPSHTLTLQSCAPTYFINGVCTSPFVVKARDFNVLYTTASIAVTVGPSVVKPNIVLVGAKFIGPCGDLTVDATASTGNANRPFRIKWFGILTSAIPSDVPLTNATALHAAATTFYSTLTPLCGSPYDSMTSPLSSEDEFTSMCKLASLAASATSLMWTVNRADLVSATSYVFGVELTNYFNEKSASSYTVQTLSDPVPVVSIAGATTLSIRRPNALLLSATTAPVVTNCSTVQSTSKVQFQWTVESPPTWTLVNTAVDPRSFSLAPNVLQAGTAYRFRVDAFYPSQPTLKSSDWATVTVTPSDLVAKLVNGDHVVGSADPLVVNASLSFDPDRIPIPLTFVWSCQDVTANVNRSGASMDAARPCINPQTSSVIAMSTVNSSVLVLPALSYAPAKVLNISVSVVQNCTGSMVCSTTRTRSVSVMVTTVSGRVPVVRCQSIQTRVNPTARVMLTASVESLYPYTTMWSQDQGDLVLSSRNSSVGSVTLSPFVFPLSTMQNAIAANTLTPGKTYIFRLTATDSNGAQGFGTVSITVNSPPTPGTLTISPPIGMAIQDQFTLRCENWSDEDQPLQYSFFKLDSSTRGWVPLSSPQSLPSTQTRLFLTNTSETNGTVQVIAVVTDAMGASTTVAASTVVVQPIVYDPAAFWTATSNGTFATSLNSGNLNDAMTVLMSTSALVSVKASCNATSCGENGRCNNVTAACDCVPGYTGSTCSMSTAVVTAMTSDMLSSLASVTTMMDPTPASLTQTIYTLSNIVALNDVSTMDAANVATAANMLKDTTSSMMAQEDPSTIVTSVGSTVLTAASSLLQSTKKDLTTTTASPSRRRLADSAWADGTSSTLMQSLFYMAAMSSLHLLAGELPVKIRSSGVATFSVFGSKLTFAADDSTPFTSTVQLTPAAATCLGDSFFTDVVVWTLPSHTRALAKDTPPLAPSVTVAIHTTTALLEARYQGQPLTMSTIASNDPCLRDQNLKAGNVDASRPLVALTFGHSALTTGPRFTTACRLWNSATSSWDATSVCSKDTLRSTATSTTCVCDALMNIEVVVVSEEILSFVPEHPTLFRNENPSVVPVATLSVLLVAYAAGLVWGNRRDKADKEAVRLKRLGMLSKETWKELLLHESTKATATLRNSLGPQLDMYKQSTANAFMSTFHTTNSHDPKPANDSTALTAIAAESFALDQLADMALNEGALFGTLRLQAQHVLLRQALQVVNAFLIIVSVVFLAVGVDFIHFLGNTTHSVVLVLYGPTVGTFFLAFGLALAAVALLGILVAYRNTSSRLRGLYMFLMFVLLVGECVVLAIAYKHLVDLESFPQTTRAYLQTLWGGFSSTIRGDIQTQLGCCGFVATTDAPVLPCPEESIQDSAAPRTCFRVLTVAASALFENVLSSLGGVVMSQIVALAIANVLVRWESIRIENLSQGVKGDTSLFTIFLRCTLPVCCHLSGCSVVLGIAGGLDVLLEWDLFSLASASVFLKLEVGLPLVTLSGLYFLLHTMGGWALAGVHVRPMKWFAVGQVVLLVAGVCSSIALYTVASNLGSYANLQSMVEARYVALPTHSKLHLETALMCCGYSMQSQGTCTSSTLPLCAAPITAAVQQFCLTTLNRMLVFLTSQACLLLFTAVFLAHQNSHVDTMALTLDTTNEFTDSTSVVVTRVCTQVLVFASVVVLFSGCILVAVACDLLFATNLVTVSAALVAFSYHAGTYTLLLGLAVLTVGSLGIYAGLTRRKKWLWALAVVLCGVAISLLSLFAAAYRIEHPQTPTALNATLLSTWTDFAPSTKLFVQEAYSCCGFAEVVAAAGDVTFTLPYLEPTWDDANNLTNVVYTPHCPDEATEGCSVFMMETLTQTAAVVTRSSVALCALLAIVFLATGVLYYRQGKKKPVTWQVWILQVVMVVVASGVALTLLGLALVGVDVAAGTTVFTSSVIQTLFGHSLGALLVVCVTYACAVTSYGVYGSIQQILHVVFIYMVLTFGLVVLGWSSVAIVSSMTTSMSSWQPLLDSTLDALWTDLSFDARMFVAVSRQCCGYNDPAPVGALYKYDRATSADGKTLACPRNLRIGCRSVLLHDSAILLGQLFQLLVAFSTLETVALITSAFLLRGLSVLHRDVWVGIVKKMRWWGAKYRDDIDRRHVTLSLWKTYDAKFTRPQRLTCILCAVTTLAFVDAAVQARFGCTRMSSMDCQPHSTAALLSLGFLYSIVSAVVQVAFVRLFVHIRHRHDDDDTAKIAERRRKEKVYFRDVMQHSLHALMAKLGHLTMVTSEERFYSWFVNQVDWVAFVLCWLRVFLAVAILVYMVLGKVGLGFYMFGLEVPSSVDFVAVPGLMLLSAVAVLMCTSFKRRKVHSRYTHIGLRVATGASLVLVALLALVVFLILQALEEPTTPRNWTMRNTGFSVVDALRELWLADTSGVLRLQWQSQLGCCGFPEFPARPCPPGPSSLQNVTATKVDGTIITKRITVVEDLEGCQGKMVAQVQTVAQIVLAVFIVMGIVELMVAACTHFLARDILISWDAKLRRASVKKGDAPPPDELFDMSPATIAPPQRGRITSSLVQSSIDNISVAVATALAQTPLSSQTRLQPMAQEKLQRKLRIRYPSWIVKVVYVVCGLWCIGFGGGAIWVAWDLSNFAALPWLGVFVWSAVLHGVVVEPAYVFGVVVSKTLSAWWKQTWMAALIGMGKAILHLDDATPDEATTIMDPFLRIRHSSAIVIQRRWVAKLARLRYLVILRVARENAHRVAIESRARQIKAAIAGFTREEVDAFAVLFRDADHAKTGLVSYKVVSQAVYALGVKVPTAVVKQYLEALDPGFVDLIDQDYFMYAMSCIRGYHQDQQVANLTTDKLVLSSSLEGKTQVKKQNMLRDLKDKRTTISKQLMNKVERLTSKLRADSNEIVTAVVDDAKPSGAYVLLNTKKTLGNASPPRVGHVRQATLEASNMTQLGTTGDSKINRDVDSTAASPEQVQTAVRPTPKAMLSVRATKDMEKAIHQMKLKQKSKK
ncbi:hypothetical protein, variant [Aphanomyces invadans]|nr:hypothetical protein, variant [Aphanomyces invadans]ETW01090.1 hypothetical protein, variant [Aphanomyces invadans]|eukprot:XP_008870088.1 hypothetical protein, variant [Aphanomyces invadans]